MTYVPVPRDTGHHRGCQDLPAVLSPCSLISKSDYLRWAAFDKTARVAHHLTMA